MTRRQFFYALPRKGCVKAIKDTLEAYGVLEGNRILSEQASGLAEAIRGGFKYDDLSEIKKEYWRNLYVGIRDGKIKTRQQIKIR